MRQFVLTSIPEGDEELRPAIRDFIAKTMPSLSPEMRARSWMGFDANFSRELAKAGWVGLSLPKEFGGGARSVFARFVVVEELLAAGAPVSAHWIAERQSGPLILKYGTQAQKQFFLPKICSAEAFFCIGMSEPNAGSDLASVKTRAQRTASGWILNGQKLWTTNASRCQYMIVLARTSSSGDDPRDGLSQFVVDLTRPGITIRPIADLAGDFNFAEVFFEDTQISADALIGEEGAGWGQVMAELAFERSGPERLYSSIVLADTWLADLRGRSGINNSDVTLVGAIATRLAALRAMSVSVAGSLSVGESPVIEAALVKDLGTDFEQWIPSAICSALGQSPAGAEADSMLLKTLNYTNDIAPSYSLRGGTREILRGVIARGLGLR